MENILKNGRNGVMVRLYSLEVKQEDENIQEESKVTLKKYHIFFQEIPKGIPPSRYHDHQIELILGSNPHNKMPYK
jgi:hypothetical protein